MFKRILVAIDLAEPNLASGAIERAAELRDPTDGRIRLIYVAPPLIEAVSHYLPPNFMEKEAANARAELTRLAKEAGVPADCFSAVSLSGKPSDGILNEARSLAADLIVVGSHRPDITSYFLGSNATKVVRNAECSVLVVR